MSVRTIKRREWFHVGSMNIQDKKDSYEGSGFSISIHPNEWRKIARLSGDLYRVRKETASFLDYYKLSKKKRNEIFVWGVKQGYLVEGDAWRYEYEDEGEPTIAEFASYEEWYDMFATEAEDEEQLEEWKNSLKKDRSFYGTDKLARLSCWSRELPPSLAKTFCILRYAEEKLDVDGVYWNDILNVYRYSAPRAVIFQSRLSEWTIERIQENE